jgi:hypothetical protein
MAKRGRPTLYTEALADEILKRHAAGESLTKICAERGMPNINTIGKWTVNNQEFSHARARARLDWAEYLFAEALDIADNIGSEDTPALVQRDKLRVNTRLKMVAKINPAEYGERLEIATNEAEVKAMSDDTLIAAVRTLLSDLGLPQSVLDAIKLPAFGHLPLKPTEH